MELKPRTRKEFLIADFIDKDTPDIVPKTRTEMFLKQMLDKISSGAGGVSRWNDLTDKPFYEETSVVEVLPEYKPAFIDNGKFPITEPFVLALGERYTVNLNGTKYKGTAIDGENLGYPGAIVLVNDGANLENGTGVVVAVVAYGENEDGGYGLGAYADGSTSVTISIYHNATVIHPIEGKYLPKGTPYIEEVTGEEILPETTVAIDEDGQGRCDIIITLVDGEKYIVTVNEEKYVLTAFAPWKGAVSAANDKFAIISFGEIGFGIYLPSDTTLTEVILSINKCVTNIGKIDACCLPDGTPYVQENILLAETDATGFSHPTFGQMWRVNFNTPRLTVGGTYTVTYNGEEYKCVCQTAPAGLTDDENAVAMGNFAAVGGEDTGEPFAMLVSVSAREVDIIDLVGSFAVKVKISEITAANETYLSSPNGTIFKITVSDDGTLSATAI